MATADEQVMLKQNSVLANSWQFSFNTCCFKYLIKTKRPRAVPLLILNNFGLIAWP